VKIAADRHAKSANSPMVTVALGSPRTRDLGQIELGGLRQGIFGEVGEIAPEEVPAVPGHIHLTLSETARFFDSMLVSRGRSPYFRGRGGR